MGFFSGLKKVFKGATKIFKGVAKGIKKVGSGIWKGIKKGIKAVGKVFGKLGPIGTLALSFVLPGVGSMLGAMWTTTATTLTGAAMPAWVQAVGNGMKWASSMASKASGFVKEAFSGITNKIKGGLEWVGGKVSDGANALFKGAQDLLGVKNPASISDVGEFVGQKAKSFADSVTKKSAELANAQVKSVSPNFLDPSKGIGATDLAKTKGSITNFMVDDAIYDPANKLGISNVVGKPTFPLSLENQPLNVQFDAAAKAGIPKATIDMARAANISPFHPMAEKAATEGIVASGIRNPMTDPQLPDMMHPTSNVKSSSLLDRVLKAGSGLLSGVAQPIGLPAFQTADVPDPFGTRRFGVGGEGSAGGQFLSEAQRRQQALFSQLLSKEA
jgi:hypothetical protein